MCVRMRLDLTYFLHLSSEIRIGNPQNLRSFEFETKKDDVKRCYRSQSNSWMTGGLFDYYIRFGTLRFGEGRVRMFA